MNAYSYEEQGKNVVLFIPEIATRDGKGIIASRVGFRREGVVVGDNTDLVRIVQLNNAHCVLIDEAQFLKEKHVKQLVTIVDELNVPVIAYGLLKDFKGQLFEGSKALVMYADELDEIETVCSHPECDQKANFIL
jgi:thymidine kinase